ncbi:unnamed protein product [Caenorhabditis nigoni]
MSSLEQDYRDFLDIYCPVFFFATLIMQFIVLYFIIFLAGKMSAPFRIMLAHTSICQLILLFITMSCQFRMISSHVPVEVRVYGPLRFVRAIYTYALHQAWQFFMFMSGMSIIVTLFFKLMTVNAMFAKKWPMFIAFCIFHIPVVFSGGLEVYLVITAALPAEIQEALALRNLDVSLYSVTGTLRLQTVSLINFIIMVGAVFVYPIASFLIAARTLFLLNRNVLSKTGKAEHRSFIAGLCLQSLLPVLTYFPTFVLYVHCVLTGTEMLFQQYGIYLMPTTPALIDPFLTLTFMVPFRNRILTWVGLRKPRIVNSNNLMSVTRSFT